MGPAAVCTVRFARSMDCTVLRRKRKRRRPRTSRMACAMWRGSIWLEAIWRSRGVNRTKFCSLMSRISQSASRWSRRSSSTTACMPAKPEPRTTKRLIINNYRTGEEIRDSDWVRVEENGFSPRERERQKRVNEIHGKAAKRLSRTCPASRAPERWPRFACRD